jgi:hypothetical protein
MALFFWIVMDFYRVARVRRMLTAVLRQDVSKLRKVADTGLKARAWLRKISGRQKNKPVTKKEVNDTGMEVAKSSLKVWAGRAFLTRKLTPAGLLSSVAMGAAIQMLLINDCKKNSRSGPILNRRPFLSFSQEISSWEYSHWLFSHSFHGCLVKRHLHALPARGRTEAPPCHCSS